MAFGAPSGGYDNNITYRQGEHLQIISKKGVDVLLETPDADFSIVKDGSTVFGVNGGEGTGVVIKDKTAEQIIDEVVEAKLAEIAELINWVKAFQVDYSAFKVTEDARFAYVYDEIGHTSLTELNTNNSELAFSNITVDGTHYSVFRSAKFANGTGLIGTAVPSALFKLKNGTDPTKAENWDLVNGIPWPTVPITPGKDKQKYSSGAYFRSIYFNEKDGKWYGLRQAYGIWSSTDGLTWTREDIYSGTTQITAEFVNTYHLAIGADGTLVATTEYGPVYKNPGEDVWHVIPIEGLTNDDGSLVAPARAIATGNTFVVEPSQEREVKLTRDLGATSQVLPGLKSRFVLGSTGGQGIWYSNPTNILSWTKAETVDGTDGKRGAEEGSFRQIVYHNGTFVAPIFYTEDFGITSDTKNGIYYSTDAIHWKLCPGTIELGYYWYEPQFVLGMFVVPSPWQNAKLAVCADPTKPNAEWKLIDGKTYGYGIAKTDTGAISFGEFGIKSIKSSAFFVSGSVPTKSDVYTKAEVDALIRRMIEESRNARSGSLQ